MKEHDISIIFTRPDGSYLVDGGLFHVPNEGGYAGLWAQVDEYARAHPEAVKPEAAPAPTPEELAAQTLAEAKAERARAVAALAVEVDGMTFDGDEKAQERMARAVLMAESPEESMEWVLADSSVAVVTADQLRRACRAAGKAMGTLWVMPYKS